MSSTPGRGRAAVPARTKGANPVPARSPQGAAANEPPAYRMREALGNQIMQRRFAACPEFAAMTRGWPRTGPRFGLPRSSSLEEVLEEVPTVPETPAPAAVEPDITPSPTDEAPPAAEELSPGLAEGAPPAMEDLTPEPMAEREKPDTMPAQLVVDDTAASIEPGQIKRTEFLEQLRTAVEAAVDEALAGTGRSTRDCPYLDYWFGFYSNQDSQHLERAGRRYAPETVDAATASEFIALVAARGRRAAEIWAQTGQLTGVPEGVPLGPGAATSAMRLLEDPQTVRSRLGSGRPLDARVRTQMEAAYGRSFSHVRVHDDSDAANLSAAQRARAFAVGSDVVFGAGEYRPGTLVGDALIAHEIAHVVQQSGPDGRTTTRGSDQPAGAALEEDADNAAVSAVASLWGRSSEVPGRFARPLMPRLRSGLRLQRCKDAPPPGPATVTPVVTPTDNFSGRSLARLGLGEIVDLSFTSSPASTAAALGGLTWIKESGDGMLTPGADGAARFTAKKVPGTVKLRLQVGPTAGKGPVVSLDVVAPSGATMVKEGVIRHTNGFCGVGFTGRPFLHPDDVSFQNLRMKEGTVAGVGHGFYSRHNGRMHAETSSWVPFLGGDAAKGTGLTVLDSVDTGDDAPPFALGDFLWAIPWIYEGEGGSREPLITANHKMDADAAGTATIDKAGAGPFTKAAADATTP